MATGTLAGLEAARINLAGALADATGLVVDAYPPDKPAAPCGFVDWARETITLNDDLAAGCVDVSEVRLRVRWVVPRAADDGPARLDALIAEAVDVAAALPDVHGPYDWVPARPLPFGAVTHLVADLTVMIDL